ncbi:WD repeat-containing protein 54-like isoform X3 [Hemitrygon akajei]|uniref:WD repeat-containing protein 54-like isoform X3 n=1 Tax=Hemitrygon akajei TaxID=2704970 RepID=UPI003BF9C406
MYKKEKGIQIKSSASALYNNLSVLPITHKNPYFAVIHGGLVNMVSASADGLNFSHRQLQSKEGGMGHGTSLIMQASWCVLPSRILLVLASQKGIQAKGTVSLGQKVLGWETASSPGCETAELPASHMKYRCMNQMAPSWSTGMQWIPQKHKQMLFLPGVLQQRGVTTSV